MSLHANQIRIKKHLCGICIVSFMHVDQVLGADFEYDLGSIFFVKGFWLVVTIFG